MAAPSGEATVSLPSLSWLLEVLGTARGGSWYRNCIVDVLNAEVALDEVVPDEVALDEVILVVVAATWMRSCSTKSSSMKSSSMMSSVTPWLLPR